MELSVTMTLPWDFNGAAMEPWCSHQHSMGLPWDFYWIIRDSHRTPILNFMALPCNFHASIGIPMKLPRDFQGSRGTSERPP